MILVSLFSISIFNYLCLAEISNKQYASMPEIFQIDNYDRCMLLEDDALYCTIQYELEPLNDKNGTGLWEIIQEVSSDIYNYRHDHLRHSICVPLTCQDIELPIQDESTLRQKITDCYDKKFVHMGLRGTITKLNCNTDKPWHSVDWIDKTVALVFLFYLTFVMVATAYDCLAAYRPEEEYNRITNTKCGKLFAAFSIARNWNRLRTVKHNPETEKLRIFQGLRFYNVLIVMLAHSSLASVVIPQSNPKYVETTYEKVSNLFLSSGPLCVSTNFFMSSFFLFLGVFSKYEGKKDIKPKDLLHILIARYLRLTPCLLVVLTISATWARHSLTGSYHYNVEDEYFRCRKNWWTNVFYINTLVDNRNMCLPATWYLALDMQYYVFLLVVIYYMKKHPNLIWHIICCLLSLNIIGTFIQNYIYDFPGFMLPHSESFYDMKIILPNPQWHNQQTSVIGNLTGPIIGLAFGYIYYTYGKQKLVVSNFRLYQILVFTIFIVCSYGIILIPGIYFMMFQMDHESILASLYVAGSRPIFDIGIACLMFGCVQGFGGLVTTIFQWHPAYILGRLSYTSYLIHPTVIALVTANTLTSPFYSSDGTVLYLMVVHILLSLIAALLLTLFVEMPMAQLQKLATSQPSNEEKKER